MMAPQRVTYGERLCAIRMALDDVDQRRKRWKNKPASDLRREMLADLEALRAELRAEARALQIERQGALW